MKSHIKNRVAACSLLCFVLGIVPSFAQQTPSISVTGDIKQPLYLTAADLAAMPRAKAVTDNNGISTIYEGVWLSDILKKAGVPLGPGLRGSALAGYVVASASDGYQVLFSIGELDPDMTSGQYLLADTANGKPLFGENGAFRLVIPTDKRGARSVRLLTRIEVVHLKK
jgi:DMSO/TMAO reductase YedYZ molybdopterin-dependent catalytic subunit